MSSPQIIGVIALAAVGILTLTLVMAFLLQSLIKPELIAGSLSEAVFLPCNQGKQWILYDCKPNPITGFGCISPGTGDEFMTYKTVAVQSDTCRAKSVSGGPDSERKVSWVWQEQGSAAKCVIDSAVTGTAAPSCCEFTGRCSRLVTYLCVRTPEYVVDGENQCTPSYLPAPYPEFNSRDNDYSKTRIFLHVPCRENYCGATTPTAFP